jgi:transcriptional antiterminator RfaH
MTVSNWLLLQVKPRQEMRALENLERQQAKCYCPLIQVEKLIRGKRIHVEEALFPGYFFINFDPQKSNLTYTAIRSSRGVSKIVRFGEEPAKVPESLILQIKDCEKVSLLPLSALNLPQKGDTVIIIGGPFKGLKAVYSQTDGQQRSIVLISLLHQQAPTSLANTQIQKIA